ncbi:hypothetical protein MJG53_005770 [Ovis ammon polii x Ovis aries]|uniref:Uncharacterized protein n=1 Tax=Ovis ammon polii x Ovis aries TaxID=2918886 RepID=A0ACB9V744_9CETA|nr:hypothetical protein MJG53_005770 [Ovis ammon polii x Ovis aries]
MFTGSIYLCQEEAFVFGAGRWRRQKVSVPQTYIKEIRIPLLSKIIDKMASNGRLAVSGICYLSSAECCQILVTDPLISAIFWKFFWLPWVVIAVCRPSNCEPTGKRETEGTPNSELASELLSCHDRSQRKWLMLFTATSWTKQKPIEGAEMQMDQVVGSIICLDGTAVEYVGACERQVLCVENLEKALAKVRTVC